VFWARPILGEERRAGERRAELSEADQNGAELNLVAQTWSREDAQGKDRASADNLPFDRFIGQKKTGPPEGEPAYYSDMSERQELLLAFGAFCSGQFAFVAGGLLGDTCRFTGTATKVVKFRATYVTAANDFDFVDCR